MNSGTQAFIEVDYCQVAKERQLIGGDVFLSQKLRDEDRVVAVLSDGLGSGVKANVLATLTATMAMKYTASNAMDTMRSAETIMNTLPICSVRKISYSTFTIVDIDATGKTRIIEHGNPSFLLLRPDGEPEIRQTNHQLKHWNDRVVCESEFQASLGDRIVFFSDGVSQAGTGENATPLGWGHEAVRDFVANRLSYSRFISARDLARAIVDEAIRADRKSAKDDVTCAVIYFRNPRKLLIATGPPFAEESDAELARVVDQFKGRKVICGGTTANIVGRVLEKEIAMTLDGRLDPRIPPTATMDGIDLVTEGTLTLGEVARILESGIELDRLPPNGARRLTQMLLESDIVQFVVGTRINEAHQDPNIPVELDLRRNIVKRISHQLEQAYLKQTSIRYL
jgi:hypothetical protein